MSNATWLASVLRTGGCTVKTYEGWKGRGRPGEFEPFGVLWHHTGTPTGPNRPAPSVGFCITGSSALTGPLCHVVIGYDGVCHVIAAGRANHAGTNRGSGPVPPGSGNAQFIGFEIDYSGSQDMGPKQMEAALKATVAVLKHFDRTAAYTRGHKETSTAGKWDPGRHGSSSPEYRMDAIRAKVANLMIGKVRYVLFDGEGGRIARSSPVSASPKPRKARLKSFLDANIDKMDAEFEQDKDAKEPQDVRIRRVPEN